MIGIIRRTLLVLAIVFLIVFVLLGWLLATDSGFARATSLANKFVPGLAVEGPEGNLLNGVLAKNLRFENDAIKLQASQLETDWQLKCLVGKRFCLNNLHIAALDIEVFANDEPPEPPRNGPITLPNITLPIAIEINKLSVDTVRFKAPDDAPVQIIKAIKLTANAAGSDVHISTLSLDYQQFSTLLTGDIKLTDSYPLSITLSVKADDVLPDTVPDGEGKQPLTVDAVLSDSLKNLALDTTIRGVVDIDLQATLKPLELDLPANINLSSELLGWPVTSRTQVLANDTSINISGDLNDYSVSLKTHINGKQVPPTGITMNAIANAKRVTIPNITIDTLGGSAQGSALLSLDEPRVWSTNWSLEDLDPSKHVPELSGNLSGLIRANGTIRNGKWSLKLDQAVIEGELRGFPFKLDSKLSKGLNDLWFIEHVSLNNDKNQLKLQGIVGDELSINGDINLPQLQNFVPGLAGGFDAKLQVDGPFLTPNVNVEAHADVLRFKDILIRTLSIDANIQELFVDQSKLEVKVATLRVGENTVADTTLNVGGTRTGHVLTLGGQGPHNTALDLQLSGSLKQTFDWTGTLDSLQAELPDHQLVLKDAIKLAWNNDAKQGSVSAHCWSISEQSSLCLEDDLLTDTEGEATVALSQYSLQQLNGFLPANTAVSGELDANVILHWGDDGPTDRHAQVSASIHDAHVKTMDALGDPVTFGYDDMNIDADLAPDDVQAKLSMNSQSLGNTELSVQLDPSDKNSAINGVVELQGLTLAIVEPFLPDFDKIGGTLSAKGNLGGTLAVPNFDGSVVLDSPVVQADILPLPITGGKITARIVGQSLALDGEALSDKGRIAISGRGTLDPEKWNAEINLTGENLAIKSDPVQDSTINHKILIVANAQHLSVTGNVDVPQAVIDVADLPQGAATVSSDVIIIEDEFDDSMAGANHPPINFTVAVDVSLGDDVTLSAYGLNANLTGDMDVRLRGGKPLQLGGEIRVVDGIFKKYGQNLEANGQVIFVGPINSTRLAIDAVREIENEAVDRTAGLRIQGTVETPAITLFTEPSDKSQDAILSYIVLGRDINEASDQEADLLATAALALAIKGGQSFGGNVASALGVKEFGLETRGTGNDTELIVSGRLNDRLLLRYGRGVFDAENTLYLRYDLTKKLYLEAAQGAQDAVDLFYSFSF